MLRNLDLARTANAVEGARELLANTLDKVC